MNLILLSLILFLSFYLLAHICDKYFVDSLDRIAKKWNMPSDVAGATLMAVGSSAPELFVAIISLFGSGGNEEIGMGTIVGSALFNVLVIIGASAVVKKAVLNWQPVLRDTAFYALSIIMILVAFQDGQIDLGEASMFVVLYIVYIISVTNWRKDLDDGTKVYEESKKEEKEVEEKEGFITRFMTPINFLLAKFFRSPKNYIWNFSLSILMIAGLSWVLVESAVEISHILHIPKAIVALTILAAGTSIPDLMSSIIVARQGRGAMAISNAIGSNIFDVLFGFGVPWIIMLSITGESIPVARENLISSVVLLFATILVIFFLLMVRHWKIGRKAGWFLILLYIMYLIWAINSVL